MKKVYSFIQMLSLFSFRLLSLIVFIGVVMSIKSNALNFVNKVNELLPSVDHPVANRADKKVLPDKQNLLPASRLTQKVKTNKSPIVPAPVLVPCPTISTLACEDILVSMPFTLNFNGAEGGLVDKTVNGTGFRMVDAYSGTRLGVDGAASSAIIGYEPSKLTVDQGKLTIATNKGIAFQTNNNQINALGVGILATGKITVETTLINPTNGNGIGSEQGGVWLGLNDRTFVKLVVTNNKVEMRKEVDNVTSTDNANDGLNNSDQRMTAVIAGLSTQTVRLRMVVDLVNNKLEGFYSTDGITFLNVGARYTTTANPSAMNIFGLALAGKTVYTGIFASHRNAGSSLLFTFEDFSVKRQELPIVTAPYRINAGGIQRTVGSDVYSADDTYAIIPGEVTNTSYALTGGGPVPELYYERRFGKSLAYTIPIANGRYTVKLQMVENFQTEVNKRKFDVKLENATVLDDYDLFADGGSKVVVTKSFDTDVSDGVLNIDFAASLDNAIINAIEILPAAAANVAPVFTNTPYNFNTPETAVVNAVVGSVSATDASGQIITYSIEAGNDAGKFAIDGATGAIKVAGTLSHATTPSYTLTVKATDNGNPVASSTSPVIVNVTEVIANVAPVFANTLYSFSTPENVAVNAVIGTVSATDASGQIVTYSITAGNEAGKFAIDGATGAIKVTGALSHATAASYSLTVSATDDGDPVAFSTSTVAITVTEVTPGNIAPVFANTPYNFSTPENAAVNAVVGTVSATDASGQIVTYSITAGNEAGKFAIDGATGAIKVAGTLSHATAASYSLTVSATDDGDPVAFSTSTVAITVTEVTPGNIAPVFANTPYNFSTPENAAVNAVVGTVSATDASGQIVTYSITAGNEAGKFAIDGTTGAIKVTGALSHATAASYSLTVTATDDGNPVAFSTSAVAITVTEVTSGNVAPVFATTPYNFSTPENAAVNAVVGTVSATDASGQIVTYSITAGNEAGKFAIDGATGAIKVTGALSHATAASYSLTVSATDDGDPVAFSTSTVAITVTEVTPGNIAPVFANTPYNFSTPENAAVNAVVGTVSATDASGQIVTYSITAGNEAGKFAIDGATGAIKVAGTLSHAAAASYSLTVTATDDGDPVAFSASSVIIAVTEVTPVNSAPVADAGISNQTTPVGTLFSLVVPANAFKDADNNPLTLSATLTDGTNLPGWLSFNAGTKTFSGTPTVAAVHSIKVTASDGTASGSTEFTITVNAVNRIPVVVTAPEAQTLTANQIFSFMTGSFSDPDAGDALTYTATLANDAVLPNWLSFSSSTQTFSGTAPAAATNLSVKITATDKALAAVTANFNITVNAAPVVIPCLPISSLPCGDINVALPFLLNFDGNEGGLIANNSSSQTGFTMVDAPSGTRLATDGTASSGVTGYEPSKLSMSGGRLTITTNKGISFITNNNQLNSLGVGMLANGKLTVETTLINPTNGNGTSSEQGGIWLGLNDKTFLKLVVTNNKVEMRKEVNDESSTDVSVNNGLNNPDQRLTDLISNLNTQTVRLRMVVDIANGKVEGFYSTNGTTYLNVGARYTATTNPATINIANMALAGKTVYAGIMATHRNAGSPVSFTFDNFSITSDAASGKVLAFAPNALDFTAVQGQTVTAKSTSLSASQGSPAVTFTSTSASWLTLPTSGLGTVNFAANNFSTTMAPGIYEATVTASADGYEPANLLINLTITSPSVAQEIKVNFQDPATTPPTGWVKDYGQPFGLRTGANQGTGLEYGWRRRSDGALLNLSVGGTTPGNGRRRTTPSDLLLATFMHMQADDISGVFNGTNTEGYWEIKVANGSYDVTVSAGDPDPGTVPESHTLNVEGVNAFSNFVPTGTSGTSTRFKSAKVRVNVSDGFLTINADGGTNTKINSALITPVNVTPYLIWSASEHSLVIEKNTPETNKTFSLDLNHSTSAANLPIALNATYGAGASNWLTFDPTHNGDEPNVTFNYTAAKNLAEGTYTATINATSSGYTAASTLIQITVLAPGANQPYVISSTPANGATNVSVNLASIAANNLYVPEVEGFRGGVDNATVTGQTVKLYKVVGTATTEIQGVVQGTGGGDAISFTPSFSLEANTKYRFVITNQVKSYSGAAFLPYEANFTTGNTTTGTPNPVAAEFAPKVVIPGTTGKKYTSLTFGPDGKFYALRLDGVIERFIVNHETGMLSGAVEIKTMTNKYGFRSSVGLTFDPSSTATNLIAWISHCSSGLTNAPEFDGNISKLTGADLENEQLVLTKLPRSKADHLVNSIAFGPDGALYFNQGSLSSMGIYDGTWQRDESLLSATVMRLDLTKLSGLTLPLDVRTTSNQAIITAAPSDNMRMSDGTYNPYASTSPLTIFASGVRNAFDLVWHSNGQLYVPANGSAAGGNSPASVAGTRRPDGSTYNGPVVQTTTSIKVQNDWLFRVNPLKQVGYYGHPNPLRGEYAANRGYLDNPKYPTTQGPDSRYRGAAYNFELNKSPNGAIEYKSNAFGGALKGRILVCRFSGGSDIIVLEPGATLPVPSVNSPDSDDRIYDIIGAQTGSGTEGITGLSGFTNPLDITEDVETGNLYLIEYNWNNISGKTAQIVLLKATAPSAQTGIATVSPSEIVDNDQQGGAAGKNHTITVANTGNSALTVTGIALDGVDKSQFQLSGAPTPSVASPVTIAKGSAITFNLAFNPTTTGVKKASLLVTSTNNPVKEVTLSGLGTTGQSGANEPSLQLVLDVHGINVNVGDDNKTTNVIHTTNSSAAILGEEVAIQAFQRGEDGPVTIEPLSVFGPQDPAGIVTGFGWYSSGQPNAKNELFTVSNANFQTVDVQTTGTLSFDPGIESFGFYSRWPAFANRAVYSENALNTFANAIPHHVRVYPLKNTEGVVIEHAYVVAMEETTSGLDYQDVVVIVRNVKPYVDPAVKALAFAPQTLSFAHMLGTPTAAKTAVLTANTGTPALTISKSANSDWLILPTAGLGTLSFGINGQGLTAGTYTSTVTVSATDYTSATLTVSLTVSAPVSSAVIAVNSSELVFDALKNTTESKRIIITNTGTSPLNLGTLSVTGDNASNFTIQSIILEGEPTGTSLAPEETRTFEVTFTPGAAVNTFNAALVINSNATNTQALTIGMYAISLNGYEGTNEPPLQTVVNVLGYKINVGWTTLADGTQTAMKGEEVPVTLFEKAGDGPVTITPVARYSPNQELPFGFYTKNGSTPVRTSVGTLSGVLGQHNTLYPQIVSGTDQFNPQSAAFGVYVMGLENRLSYTENQLNAGGPILHVVRTYPLKDRQGVLVPNSYILCFEDASNGDYQDYVFVLRNVIASGTRKALVFNTNTIDFSAPVGGTSPAKTAILTAENGTPGAITFSKSNVGWLTTPNPALGTLSFGVNTNGLPAGTYTTTVTAESAGFASAVLTLNLHVTELSANAIKVNFQLSTSTTPSGYLSDVGLAYDDTRTYGWVVPATKAPKDHTLSMRDRTTATSDARLKGMALMQGTTGGQTPGTWEVKVENGSYNVTIGVGDLDFYDSNHRINAEGVTVINGFVPTAAVPSQIATATVQVTDGKLTIDATGGNNTKINFVIAEPATAAGDFIPPVASLQFKGTLQSSNTYLGQVIATVNASDAGGSNLAQVLYSLNNGPFLQYFSPLLINSPGVYNLRARAIDGNNNQFTTNAVSFTVVQQPASNANIVVENLEKFPSNDRLVFSLIQVPWQRTNEDGTTTPFNRNHDLLKAKISNKGTGALNINALSLTNPTGWKIATINGVVYDPAAPPALTLATGASVEVGIQFIAQFTTGRVRILHDTLNILSNDDLSPKKSLILSGLWQARGEGGNEPQAREIIGAFGFKTNVGFTSNDGTNAGNSLVLNSDEILSSFFSRADASKPVYVVQMAAFHGCCAATETFQYYTKGSGTNSSLFTHHPLDGQSLIPLKNGTSGLISDGSFNPAGLFGIKMASSYSDRTRNSEGKIGMRVWKALDVNGGIIPNTYLIGHDYIGNPAVTNYDYQDNIYYISNIKPESGVLNYSELSATPSSVDFGSKQIGATGTSTLTLKNLGQIYPDLSTDPAITIKSLEITGPNQNEFSVATPASMTLTAQATTTLNVAFRPNSQGLKNAALLVRYDNNLSPLRIPLYGIADNSCSVITLSKRIKGGSDANLTINGKVWESDRTYRQGSVQLDKPLATPIAGTDDDVLYQTYLSASADLAETRYVVPLPNGIYTVRMHFVENFFTLVGGRVFNINMENQTNLFNLDIFREVGYKAALVKDFNVAITDGKLDVKWNPTVNRLALAGMEIFTAVSNPSSLTLTQETVQGSECGASNGYITFGVANSTATSFLYKMGATGAYQSSPLFADLASGDYTFYVKENMTGGCETSKAFTIPVRNTLAFTVTAPVLACADASGTATVSYITGGSNSQTITWNTIPVQTGATATGLIPGTYSVTVLDASGCSLTQQVTVSRDPSCPASAIRINAGGPAFAASGGRQFIADAFFGGTNGTSTLTGVDILNTTDDALYLTERSSAAFNYAIPVQNGTFNVVLHFAEIYFGAPGKGAGGNGKRKFNVDIEGLRKLTEYDIYQKAVGAVRAIQETFAVTVSDGVLNINFTSGTVNLPKISAIEVLPQTPAANQAPVLAAIGNKTATVGQALTFTATATDADATQTKTYSLTGQPSGATINATTGAFTWTPTAAGTVNFTVKVTDNGSPNLSDEELISVVVSNAPANQAPVLAAIGNKTATVGQALSFTATATDADATQTKTYSLVGQPNGATINATTGTFSWTPTATGTVSFTVRVTDNGSPALSDDEAISVVVSDVPANQAPVLAAIGNKTATVGQALAFTATSTDADATQTKTYSLVGQPSGATINATIGAFTWTPTAAGTVNFTVKVTDNGSPALSDEELISVVVSNVVASSTVRINAGGLAYTAGDGRQFLEDTYYGGLDGKSSITGVNIANTTDDALYMTERSSDAFNYAIPVTNGSYSVVLHFAEIWYGAPGKGPAGAGRRRFNVDIEGARKLTNYDIYQKMNGAISATTETFPVTITDGIVNINFSIGTANKPKISAIEVISLAPAANQAPVLAAIGNKTATVGQALTFTATATDADATQTKTYSLVGQPSGATINATTGAFTWTPAAAGTVNFTVKVTDNGSPVLSDEELISVVVSDVPANQAPVLATIGNKTATVGQALTFMATATDADASQTKTYSLVGQPSGATINAATGAFNWIPAAAATVSFTVRVTDNGSPALSDDEVISVVVSDVPANQAPVLAAIGNKTATVGQALAFTATSTDADATQTKTYSLVNQPSGAVINATTGAFTWTPTAAGTVSFTVRVTDNGSPALSDDEVISVAVSNVVASSAVRINAGGPAYTAGDGRQFLADTYFGGIDGKSSITGVNIANTTDDALYMTERSSDAFNYAIPVSNGSYNVVLHFAEIWYGAPGKGPAGAGRRRFNVDIEGARKLTNYDIYQKMNGAITATTETFPVTITDGVVNINFSIGSANKPKISAIEVILQTPAANQAPVLAAIGNKTATVGQALTFTATSTDPDASQTKTYSLVGQPSGATINATTGAFTWTPTAAGTVNFTVKVTDNGSPNLSDEELISVVVSNAPANQAPVLAAIGNKTATVGQALTFTATSTDPDASQTKTYSLVGQPSGATINAATGAFTWTPTAAGTVSFTVRVTDNGSPALSDDEQISVMVSNVVASSAVRINAGGPAYTAGNGRQFLADTYYGGLNGTSSITGVNIANTTDDPLYMTERSSDAFNYAIPVTNGSYNVVLHFAEIWYGAPGKGPAGAGRRRFNVDIEGARKLTNYDIYQKMGGAISATTETFLVTITDGVANINFSIGTVNKPKISAIEVIPVSGGRFSASEETIEPTASEVEYVKSRMYPNPVQKRFTIEISNSHSVDISAQMISEAGRIYKVTLPENVKAGSKAEVDISNLSLPTGVYLMRVQSTSLSEIIKTLVIE